MKHLSLVLGLAVFLLPACASETPTTAPPGSTSSAAPPPEGAAAPDAPDASAAPEPQEPGPEWNLVPDIESSRIHWTAQIKAVESRKVKGQFTNLSGGIFIKDGDLSSITGNLGADLKAVETGIPLRNQNITTYLFGATAETQPNMSVQLESVKPATKSLDVGKSTSAEVAFSLIFTVPSVEKNATAQGTMQVTISRLDEQSFKVVGDQAVLVSIKELGLSMQLDALMEMCKVKGVINDAVEANLDLLLLPPGTRVSKPETSED